MADTIDAVMRAFGQLLPWLPAIAWALLCYLVGRTMKEGPLSSDKANDSIVVVRIRKYFPLPLHPLVASLAPAASWGSTPFGDRFGQRLMYFGLGAVVSVLWHDIWKEALKWHAAEQDQQGR